MGMRRDRLEDRVFVTLVKAVTKDVGIAIGELSRRMGQLLYRSLGPQPKKL